MNIPILFRIMVSNTISNCGLDTHCAALQYLPVSIEQAGRGAFRDIVSRIGWTLSLVYCGVSEV